MIKYFWICLFMIAHIGYINAQNTKIMVRAKAKDAKFIGSSIGGAYIVVKDDASGQVLAEGVTKGTTGDSEIIMKKPHQRRAPLSDGATAGFMAELDLERPTLLNIEAHAPMNAKQAEVISSTKIWAIPEKDIKGDGIVLEIPGLIVDILEPQRHETLEAETEIDIKTNLVMMCGCPLTEDGLWKADNHEVKALISSDDHEEQEIELKLTEKINTFRGSAQLSSGFHTITVYAYDETTGNTGVSKTNIIVD